MRPAPTIETLAAAPDDRYHDATTPRLRSRDLAWAHWGRLLAIPAVVSLHVLSPASFAHQQISPMAWWGVNLVDSASRFAVPLFVAISGALLVSPSPQPVGPFYRRRVMRVGIPLLAWSVFYWWYKVAVLGRTVPVEGFLESMARGYPYTHLYFMFVILGLYAVTPIIRVVLADRGRTWLGVGAVAALGWAAAERIFLGLGWTGSAGSLDLWLHFLGYFLLGAWMRDWRPTRAVAVAAAGATALSITATALFVGWAVGQAPGWAAWGYSAQGPLTVLTTAGTLTVLLRFATRSPRWLPAAAGLTYGVYLVHPALLPLIHRVVPLLNGPLPMSAAYAVQMAVGLVGSALIVLVIQRLPVLRRVV